MTTKYFDIDEEVNEENNRSWRKKLDSAYRKQDAPPNFSGGTFDESQTLVLIKIMIILIKYYDMNSSSVFLDIGSGQSKPGLVARQIANGPTVVVGIEICAGRTYVSFRSIIAIMVIISYFSTVSLQSGN